MTLLGVGQWRLIAAAWAFATIPLAAQPVAAYVEKATVTYSRIEVKLPAPYLLTLWPSPPDKGFYAWKVTFGNDSSATIVFRTDSAIAASNARDVLRASAFFRCPTRDTAVLECVERIQGRARAAQSVVTIEITEPAFVARIRERKPAVLLRQMFEPGGRFRVDHIGATYK